MFSSLNQITAFVVIIGLFAVGRCDVIFEGFEQLGEFKVRDYSCNGLAPSNPKEIDTKFWLYNPNTDAAGEMVDWIGSEPISPNYDPNLKTVFACHGWRDSYLKDLWQDLKDSLLQREPMNVILVDWSGGSSSLLYYRCRDNTRVVGREISALIKRFVNEAGANLDNIHVVGHSLGAHIAGYAGEDLAKANMILGRITGLDPAGPLFENEEPPCRLSRDDAGFVDVIHTDGDKIGLGGAGLMQECGHHDWYPNGGKDQPGCPAFDVACDHMKAVEYFIDSVKGVKTFLGDKFANTVNDLLNRPAKCFTDGTCPEMGYTDHDDATIEGHDFM
ncbi:pancreatic lipase-related protein 2-like isoform X1 [Lytechinus variegatus]|uniref:pancreatic lipase-related protein 2-like isoform X1 n=1 Tax=Lytechinus variegatus TaxID=7654 RepID=UPI001BB24018|nr:pancreatic lipase-related protein 2-like isoform X1 [Lytechinus variegatus]